MTIFSRRLKKKFIKVLLVFGVCSFVGFVCLGIYPDINFNLRVDKSSLECQDEIENGNTLCLVVPFRDRFDEVMVFLPHMKKFLCQQKIKNNIIIVNQQDGFRFNRGSLVNIGYILASTFYQCNYIGMHDVDLLPLNNNLSYSFPHQPFHLSAPELHPNYHYKKFVGGILLINNHHFELVNGISNLYWGWGREDDEFYVRLQEANLTIKRPSNIDTGMHTFKHLHSKLRRPRDNIRFGDQKAQSRKRDRATGVNNTRYSLVSRQRLQVDGHSAVLLNVELTCDLHVTPWCMSYNQLKAHLKDQEDVLSPNEFEALLDSLRKHKIKI